MNRTTALALGWSLFAVGAFVLYRFAYDGTGRPTPWPLGAVLPF